LDLYKPLRKPGPWPVVFYVHGGGFQSLSKDTHWLMGLGFARRGYLVVNVSYRLAPRHPFPAPLADVCDAFAFAVDNLERWGGDPTRLSLAGESAGANLVAALAVATSYRRSEPWATKVFEAAEATARPRVVLASCGIHQVSDTERFRRRDPDLPRFATAIIEDVEQCYLKNPNGAGDPISGPRAMADPLVILEQGLTPDVPLPAFHLTVGTADPLLDDTRRMAAALDRLGTTHEASYFQGQPHAFHVAIHTRAARRCWREMYAFLDLHAGPLS
jgi:acetyl esterase